jgi:hypothetical protein
LAGWRRRRNNLHPAVRALFDVRVVASRVLAIIPIIHFIRLRRWLGIRWRRLLDNDRGRRIVRIHRYAPIDGKTPPRAPSRPDPDASSIVWPPPVPMAITIPASIAMFAMIPIPAAVTMPAARTMFAVKPISG